MFTVVISAALAAQVALDVDASDVRVGQTVGLSLTVVDTAARGVPAISAPEGLTIQFRGQSQERAIINFQATLTTSYRYSLTATKPGDYTLGPVTVTTSAGPLQTEPLALHVGAREDGGLERMLAAVAEESAWVGQVVVYHLRFQTPRPMVNGKWTPPRSEGFSAEPSVEPATTEYEVVQDGKGLTVDELFYPMRATSPGDWRISGGMLQAQFAAPRANRGRRGFDPGFPGMGPFTQVDTELFAADPVGVEVRALPAEGRPPGFSGLVGTFTVVATTSQVEVRAGDTVTVEVRVEGDGPLAGYQLPAWAGEGFRVYDDQPVVEAKLVEGRYRAAATFKRAVVPHVAGDLVLPPVELAAFDPHKAAYEVVTTAPITMKVTGDAAESAPISFDAGAPRTVDALAEDILPVRTDAAVTRPTSARWAWLPMVPGAAWLLLQAAPLLRRRAKVEVARRVEFDDLPVDRDGRLAGLERILRERVGARLGVGPDAVRREDLAALGAATEPADLAWRKLEAARYGSGGDLPEADVRRAVEALT